ncbi:hypothetical protein KIW84_056477 [Lathyrus oleraceus]|uniref:UDP-glycosyltransferases domain-containing protein n=1 Tax=Pisum sativum TaxID=3888 RepID=A0A9D4X1J6_PEA|nr:hypothetical protein KIW84_056477 [Pisum sativum]
MFQAASPPFRASPVTDFSANTAVSPDCAVPARSDKFLATVPFRVDISAVLDEFNKLTNEATGRENCLSWLDKQPSRSVVYLCFGSRGSFSVAQLKEIAEGLERSGHRFLWVVKRPIQEHLGKNQVHGTAGEFELSSVLPSGFIERTKERGLVVRSWAPQVEVLSRESVGGFVSHCGWNSVLEGVVAGVPMIAWPLYAEQHVNRNVMVEIMKVAVAVEQGRGDGFVSGEEVEKKVRELMQSERGTEIRETILKFKEMASDALGEFGSSTKALSNLVQTWNNN